MQQQLQSVIKIDNHLCEILKLRSNDYNYHFSILLVKIKVSILITTIFFTLILKWTLFGNTNNHVFIFVLKTFITREYTYCFMKNHSIIIIIIIIIILIMIIMIIIIECWIKSDPAKENINKESRTHGMK